MSYADYLRKQRDVYAAVWLQFSHAYQDAASEIYAFFEGSDDLSFYMPELRRRGGHALGVRPFVCNGKRTVLRLVPVVRKRLDKQWRALFFIDKDVDDFVGGRRMVGDKFIYETEWYSIENYVVTQECLRWAWTDLFRMSDTDKRWAHVVTLYEAMHRRFVSLISIVMAWSVFHRRHGRRPNLNNLDLSKLFRFEPSGKIIRLHKMLQWLDQSCGVTTSPKVWRSVRSILREFRQRDAKTYVRGKFELWFFVQFVRNVRSLIEKLPLPKTGGVKKPQMIMDLNGDNAVAFFAGRGGISDDVARFLDDVWVEIARNSV